MSTVYRATDLLLGRDVAIKIFLPGSGDDSFRGRQETEMRLLASFDHPGLVAAFDVGVDTRNDEERAYLVMELAEGRDLRAVLADGPLTVPEVARIGVQIAGALSQVHGHGVIHRDIKPANILVSDDAGLAQKVKLADFGVALVVNDSRLTATGFTVGTAQYLSPEQAQGLGLTPASDIYSLGLVLLECLTGRAEYPGTPIETASARLHRAPEIPAGLPAPLRSLLESMTDMDPEKRPVAADVQQALAEDGIQSGRRTAVLPPLPYRPPAPAAETKASLATVRTLHKRRPRIVWGVAAAAVTVPLALVIFTQGLASSGSTADNSLPAESEVSQADPQPTAPVVPVASTPAGANPVDAEPVVAVPAENVNLPEPAPVPAVQAPVPVPAVAPGATTPDNKGKERVGNKPDKPKGSGPNK